MVLERSVREDAKYFFHQSLSTPVLNVLSKTDGIYLYDLEGKSYIDMHGNGVHLAGFNNDYVIEKVEVWQEEAREDGAQDAANKIAKELLRMGMPDEKIGEATGLSANAIQKLKEQL